MLDRKNVAKQNKGLWNFGLLKKQNYEEIIQTNSIRLKVYN